MLDVTLQLSDAAVFAQIGQGGTSFIDLFVQLSDALSNFLNIESELTNFRFVASYCISTVLKLFTAPLSCITEFRYISGCRSILTAGRSPLNMFTGVPKFVRTFTEFLGHLLSMS